MSGFSPKPIESHRATIGIITALPKEFAAVQTMLETPTEWFASGPGFPRRYEIGHLPGLRSTTHTVALALLPDAGNNNAAVRTTELLHHFPRVRHIIMCGVAGGIPGTGSVDDDVRLGDVVVSDRNGVTSYDFIKQTPDGGIEERTPPRPPSPALLEAVRFLEVERLRARARTSRSD